MSKKIYIILMILYKFSLEYLFIYNISNIYQYLGAVLNYNSSKMLISWIVYIILILIIMKFKNSTFWFTIIQLLALFVITPSISLYGLKNIPTTYFIYNLVFWLIFIICSKILSKSEKLESMSVNDTKITLSNGLLIFIFLICVITTVVASYIYGDLRVLIKFSDIYKYRLELRNVEMPIYFDYMLPFMGSVLLPICIIEFLNRKKNILVAITIFIGLMLFSIEGMKTWLLSYFLVLGIYYITRKKYNMYTIINWMLFGFIICCFCGCFSSLYFNNNIISGSIYRMTIMIPELSYYYIDFVFDKVPILLKGSILRFFYDYPYPMSIEFLIGGIYIGDYATRANNGLLGDAYVNFKLLGVLLYPVLYVVVFKISEVVLKRYDYRTNYIIILILIWGSMNTSFFTWLLTGGVILIWLLYYFNKILYKVK